MSYPPPIVVVAQELAKTETFLQQNYLDKLHVKNEEALAELQKKNAKLAERTKTERNRKLVIQRMRRKLPYLKLPYNSIDNYGYEAENDPLTKLSEKEFNQLLQEEEKRYKALIVPVLFWSMISLGGVVAGSLAFVSQIPLPFLEKSLGIIVGSVLGTAGAAISLGFSILGTLNNILKKLKYGPNIT